MKSFFHRFFHLKTACWHHFSKEVQLTGRRHGWFHPDPEHIGAQETYYYLRDMNRCCVCGKERRDPHHRHHL